VFSEPNCETGDVMSTEKDAMTLALEAAIAQAQADDGEQGQLPNDGGEAGGEPVAVEQPDKPADDSSEKHDGDGDKPDGYRKAVVHHRRRAQQAEAQLQQEREQREALAAKVAEMEAQLAQAKQSGFEPRELPNEVTPEMLKAMRDGDPDAIADVAELLLRQRAPVATPVPAANGQQQQAAGIDIFALRGTEHQPVLDTLMEWRDDAQDGLGNVAWDTAMSVEAELVSDPQYSHVSTEVFYKTVVERTRERIQQGGKLKAAQQLAGSADKMPESLSAAGSGVRGGEIDPVSQMLSLEGQALVDYINNLTPAARAKVMGAGAF